MFNVRNIITVAAISALALVATGCSDSDDNPTNSALANANVLVTHASPDAPGVDIYVDNGATPAVTNLEFPTNTGYVALPAGNRNVKVNAHGTATTVIDADLTLVGGKAYSVFAVDSLSSIEPLMLEDDLTAPAAGKVHVRFVHLSPDAPAVDVAVTGGPVVFANVSFKGYQGFTPLDAGTYDLEVRVAGTLTVALSLPGTTFEAGRIYTVFARGFLGGLATQALGAEVIVNK